MWDLGTRDARRVAVLAAVWALLAAVFAIGAQVYGTGKAEARPVSQCVTLITGRDSGDLLINRCPVCRVVSVERKRPSDSAPVYREFTVPKSSRTTLSFRGPGRARVVSDQACRAGESDPGQDGSEKPGTCVRFSRRGGDLILTNSCAVCRSVVIKRTAAGQKTKHQGFTLAARAAVPVPSQGAAQAQIMIEKQCPGSPRQIARPAGPASEAAARLESLADRNPLFKDQGVETKRAWKSLQSRASQSREYKDEAAQNAADARTKARQRVDKIRDEASDAADTVRDVFGR